MRSDAKQTGFGACLEAAAEQLRALAHADEAVAVGRRCAAVGRVGDGELQRLLAERHLDVCAAASVAGCVGQRLLEDPVRRPVDGGCELPATAVEANDDGEPRGAVALGERLECGETRRRLDRTPVGGAVLAEDPDELVDLAQRLACDLLDRLERGPRSRWILLLQQPCGARPGRGSR